MLSIEDDSVFTAFEEQELLEPSPRKLVDDRAIYLSRELRIPKDWGAPVLCDFGSAVTGDVEHTEDVQPNVYRAPEVILEAPWSYQVDIWNAGCMVRTATNQRTRSFSGPTTNRDCVFFLRSGTSSKAAICSQDMIQNIKDIAAERTLLR